MRLAALICTVLALGCSGGRLHPQGAAFGFNRHLASAAPTFCRRARAATKAREACESVWQLNPDTAAQQRRRSAESPPSENRCAAHLRTQFIMFVCRCTLTPVSATMPDL